MAAAAASAAGSRLFSRSTLARSTAQRASCAGQLGRGFGDQVRAYPQAVPRAAVRSASPHAVRRPSSAAGSGSSRPSGATAGSAGASVAPWSRNITSAAAPSYGFTRVRRRTATQASVARAASGETFPPLGRLMTCTLPGAPFTPGMYCVTGVTPRPAMAARFSSAPAAGSAPKPRSPFSFRIPRAYCAEASPRAAPASRCLSGVASAATNRSDRAAVADPPGGAEAQPATANAAAAAAMVSLLTPRVTPASSSSRERLVVSRGRMQAAAASGRAPAR